MNNEFNYENCAQDHLERVASEKAGLDERKGETLEDMSGLVHQLTLKATVTDIRYHSLGL